jgi:hypothetical protein
MRVRYVAMLFLLVAGCGQNKANEKSSSDKGACSRYPGVEKAPIELQFDVSFSGERKPTISLITNLPEGTEVGARVSSPGFPPSYTAQDKGRVRCGAVSFGPFSTKMNDLPVGKYDVSVTAPLVIVQPHNVRKYLGADYEVFRSDLITKRKSADEIDGSIIDYEATLEIKPPS